MIYFNLILAAVSRLIPHSANLTSVGAATAYIGRRKNIAMSILFVIVLMVITDLFLGFSFTSPFVYLGFASYGAFGFLLKNKRYGAALAPILGSVTFFFVSNLGVFSGPWYPHTPSGLISCFVAAIPFYKGTIIGDISFSILIYASELILNKIKNIKGVRLWDMKSLKANLIKK